MLYQADVGSFDAGETTRIHWEREGEPEVAVRSFAEHLVRHVLANRERIDRSITAAAENWSIERMGAIDRNVVRLALAELECEPDTPPAVVIDEAVEIARTYGESESSGFVHGLIEGARRRSAAEARRGPPKEDAVEKPS